MIRIVGLQRGESPEQEFILLQNQGSMRISLRGHVVVSDQAIGDGNLATAAHVFSDDELVPAGMYVLLTTCEGTPRWGRTKEGGLVFHAYMGRNTPVWLNHPGPIHVLSPQHTHVERSQPALLLR